jgi:hypothetical protein
MGSKEVIGTATTGHVYRFPGGTAAIIKSDRALGIRALGAISSF